MPSAPRDAPSAFEQKAVSRRDLAGRHEVERRHVERAHRDPVAAVRHVEQQRAIRARGIGRDEKGRVAAEAHLPILAALRAIEIDDARVGRMRGVHRVVRDGVDSLVRSGISERPAFIERLAPHDLQSCQSHVGPSSSMCICSAPAVYPGSARSARRRRIGMRGPVSAGALPAQNRARRGGSNCVSLASALNRSLDIGDFPGFGRRGERRDMRRTGEARPVFRNARVGTGHPALQIAEPDRRWRE